METPLLLTIMGVNFDKRNNEILPNEAIQLPPFSKLIISMVGQGK